MHRDRHFRKVNWNIKMNRNNDFCSGSALVYELLSEVCFNHFVLKVSTSVVQKAKPFAFSTQRPRGFRFFSSSLWKSRESVNRDRCVTRIDCDRFYWFCSDRVDQVVFLLNQSLVRMTEQDRRSNVKPHKSVTSIAFFLFSFISPRCDASLRLRCARPAHAPLCRDPPTRKSIDRQNAAGVIFSILIRRYLQRSVLSNGKLRIPRKNSLNLVCQHSFQ